MRSPVAVEGVPFIAAFAAIAIAGEIFCPSVPGSILLWLLTGWCIWFFRDPERHPPMDEGLVIAPADGRVIVIEEVAAAPLSGQPARKCSIFMNVFNVHVNRCPIDGSVSKLAYHPGRFFNAALDKASLENERMEILLTSPSGVVIPFVQVAGLIARRIICRLQPGQEVARGGRFGLIRFGSRVDVYLPLSARIAVSLNEHTRAGETILAHLEKAP
ncbi:phosphatidylserine decarboxylase family protein [Candidatus Magnetaquicoccus inordinatus]|uniref:phosphatidylserine decarboxylase family protein n=1 Tax=Candidatus Magnetaquicoccus inordinatus TaxID=2496818 RepID=UPI001D0E3C04|nr:phosphatidylserine decarboxylase family protein [Candidatus Magnetaquicoccus inordinatus]